MINNVTLVGRLTKDVELRKTQSGISVAQFTVACDRMKKADQEHTADFINCVAWRQPAEFLNQYAKKGNLVGVVGSLQTRSYDRDGQRIYVTEVNADKVRLLESKNSNERHDGNFRKEDYRNEEAKEYVAEEAVEEGLDISSDDLPF